MTIGIGLALLAGLIWSVTNIADKYVISKHLSNPGLIYIPLSVVHIVFGGGVFIFFRESVEMGHLLLLVGAAIMWIIMGYTYFMAARIEEISRVVPVFSLVTVFIAVISAIVLNEIFSLQTYFGIAIVVAGSVLIMLRDSIKAVLQSRAFGLMIISAFTASAQSIVSKYLLDYYSYWTIYAWFTFFVGIIGMIVFAHLIPLLRQTIKERGWKGVVLYSISESNSQIAVFFYVVAISFWYVSLASAVVTIQYLFLFLWTIILTRLKSGWINEEITRMVSLQKIIAIILIIGGIFLIT
ncbi:EamA family transporter [Patescibacteria group bacterium]|nr:EamA family transporter [Patescibacteria group bacterium]MBU1890811.1 EamA family transporter [Patescibacteria group bacterium]